jgi:hypothetical protein
MRHNVPSLRGRAWARGWFGFLRLIRPAIRAEQVVPFPTRHGRPCPHGTVPFLHRPDREEPPRGESGPRVHRETYMGNDAP